MSSDKVIVSCALTGVLANRDQCPHVPYTPVEIAEEARRAYEAGAAAVHIHARTDDGAPTFDAATFAAIKREVRARCPVILNFSTGNLEEDTSEQRRVISEVRPEVAALNMGTMNYAKYSRRRKSFVFDMIFPNPFSKIVGLLRTMVAAGVKPEMECFDTGHTASIEPLIDMGLLSAPMEFSFVMGVMGGIPARLDGLRFQASLVPEGSQWQVIGIGREQWRLVSMALVLGGNIRVGLEDNFYLPSGEMATGNGPLVEKAVAMVRDVGREPASPEEARVMLGLPPLVAS